MQRSIFSEAEGEDILSWLNKFEFIASNNNLTEKKQGCLISMYLDKPTLIYYNSLREQTKASQQLVKQAFRTQDHSADNGSSILNHTF